MYVLNNLDILLKRISILYMAQYLPKAARLSEASINRTKTPLYAASIRPASILHLK